MKSHRLHIIALSGLLVVTILFALILRGCGGGGGGGGGGNAGLIRIEVTPTNPSIAMGTTQQFIATGVYSDNTTQDLTTSVTWSSPNPTVAIIGGTGLATAVAVGSTTITATFESISGSTTLTVTAATLTSISVTPTNPSIAKGTTKQFTSIGTFSDGTTQDITTQVVWSSSNTGVAAISNTGLATSAAVGSTTITATFESISGSTTLTVTAATLTSILITPTNPSIAKGTSPQFTATGTFSDSTTQNLTTQVTWSSSDTGVATIGNTGLAASVAVGTTTISATSGSISGTTTLTVTPVALMSITVTLANPSIAKGTTQQFAATGTFSDSTTQNLTTQVTWGSSDTSIATISNAEGSNGLVTAIAVGSTTITATSGSISGNTTLTVTPAALVSISVTPANPSISKGATQQFMATGTFSDSATQDLTAQVAWSSSDTEVATISNASGSNGLVTAIAVGSATIAATSGSVTNSTTLTVTAPILVSITVTPVHPCIILGTSQQFIATGIYTDNSTQNLTTQVTWSSTNLAVATISNVLGSIGLATSFAVGSTTISATSESISGNTTLTVSLIALPKTGQAICHNSLGNVIPCTGTGQDGELQKGIAWPSPRFTVGFDAEADCVTDNLTGLMWVKSPSSTMLGHAWQDALNYANGLILCGYSDWRLPNVNEMGSLVNAGEPNSTVWLNAQGFGNTQGGQYPWTSTTYTLGTGWAWVVDMWLGEIFPITKDAVLGGGSYTWAVRGATAGPAQLWKTGQAKCYDTAGVEIACTNTGQDGDPQAGVAWPIPRFTVGTGTEEACVRDNLTGLMWVKSPDSQNRSWQDALNYANNLTLCGYTDWRLPNVKELRSHINFNESSSAFWLNTQGFTNVNNGYYWSSSTYVPLPSKAWSVNMYVGNASEITKTNPYFVWPVRGGQ